MDSSGSQYLSMQKRYDVQYLDIESWEYRVNEYGWYAVYRIRITMNSGHSWTLEKRYSDFFKLRESLCEMMPASAARIEEFPFPQKQLFFNLHEATLETRRLRLREFMASVMSYRPPHNSLPHLQLIGN
jgi:hypothetical protein